jgi:AraC-like DNA-binding protein
MPITLVMYRFDPRYPSVPNYHDHFEITYFLTGQGTYTVGGRVYRCRAGDVFAVRGGVFHVIEPITPPHLSVLALYFAPEAVRAPGTGGLDLEYLSVFPGAPPAVSPKIPLSPAGRQRALDCLSSIARELHERRPFHRIAVKNALCDILLVLNRSTQARAAPDLTPQVTLRDAQRLRPVFDLIRQRLTERIKLRDLARAAAMAPTSFSRYFRRVTGQTVTEYMTRFRVDRAKELLLTTDRAITWIAFEVGFESHSYFDRVFRRIARSTPHDFRKRHGPTVPIDVLKE